MSKSLVRLSGFASFALFSLLLAAQTGPDPSVTFKTKVNLVPVPVVVRDKESNAIGYLTESDFQIFDNGKPQVITRFALEKNGISPERAPTPQAATGAATSSSPAISASNAVADRFVGYVFDDLHFSTSDLVEVRQAALKHFDTLDIASSRAAIFTTSGVKPQDFTADRANLKSALNRLMPRSS